MMALDRNQDWPHDLTKVSPIDPIACQCPSPEFRRHVADEALSSERDADQRDFRKMLRATAVLILVVLGCVALNSVYRQ
jgi:hypothetical protein